MKVSFFAALVVVDFVGVAVFEGNFLAVVSAGLGSDLFLAMGRVVVGKVLFDSAFGGAIVHDCAILEPDATFAEVLYG